ncbi:hypothetical protein M9Y10_042505 [Tritrichomonas musculus]|uniref:Uncharacterized protein n=1 Tax=Tritrichomonas musculus TaxID=1915356 RepID=A0ABR2GP23_9EUKA
MGSVPPFSISDELGSLLTDIENSDRVIIEDVNLNSCLPTLSSAAPTLKSRRGTGKLIDHESLRKASNNKSLKTSINYHEKVKISQKDILIGRINELEAKIKSQMKELEMLDKKKNELVQQLEDQRTRSRLGSRPKNSFSEQSSTSSLVPPAEDNHNSGPEYWKNLYETTKKQYEDLKKALSKEGAMQRVSAQKSRMIPTPKGAPQPTFSNMNGSAHYNDNDDLF